MPNNSEKPSVNKQIDENLKRVYQNALNEQLPDKFLDLIDRLKAEEAQQNGK